MKDERAMARGRVVNGQQGSKVVPDYGELASEYDELAAAIEHAEPHKKAVKLD
jgi:hypothetical protein